jgi:GTP pyrophosphokinase
MDEIAEKGYAAHYKYKNGEKADWMFGWTKRSTWKFTSAVDFVEDFKMNLYSKEIYVLHQKEILSPYQKEQLLDFAFSIHSEILRLWNSCKREISSSKLWTEKMTK